MAKITAVIDIGSNSLTLKIYKKTSRLAFYELHTQKYKIKIGEGSYQNNSFLQKEPMQRAFEALRDFKYIIKAYKCRKTLCIATSALRDAPNKKDFIKKVDRELGIKIKIIDGDKESYLGAISAINLLPKIVEFTTIDIGGGSTEFAKVVNGKIIKTTSLQIGHVRVNEKFSTFEQKRVYIQKELEKLNKEFKSDIVVSIGGTTRTIAKYIQKRDNYPLKNILHSYSYPVEKALKYFDELLENKKYLNKISKSRRDTILDGYLAFVLSLEKLKSKNIVVSQRGIRDGIYLYDLLRSFNHKFPPNFDLNLKVIIDRFAEVPKVNNYFSNIANKLFENICDKKEYKKELLFCAKIMNINKMNFYSLIEYLEFGLWHKSRVLIAFLLQSFEDEEIDRELFDRFETLLPTFEVVERLLYILRLTSLIGLNMYIQNIVVTKRKSSIVIELDEISTLSIEEIENLSNPTKYKIKVIKTDARKSI